MSWAGVGFQEVEAAGLLDQGVMSRDSWCRAGTASVLRHPSARTDWQGHLPVDHRQAAQADHIPEFAHIPARSKGRSRELDLVPQREHGVVALRTDSHRQGPG